MFFYVEYFRKDSRGIVRRYGGVMMATFNPKYITATNTFGVVWVNKNVMPASE